MDGGPAAGTRADLMIAIWGMGSVVAIGSTMAVDDFNSFGAEQRAKWVDPYFRFFAPLANADDPASTACASGSYA